MTAPDAKLPSRRSNTSCDAIPASLEDDFAEKLDLWGAYHRIIAACVGIGILRLVLPGERWAVWVCSVYLALGLMVVALLQSLRTARSKAVMRTTFVFIDVVLVSTLTYAWGTWPSPTPFIFVVMVVGWTLVPQRGLGTFCLILVLTAVGGILIAEHLTWLPHAPALAHAPDPQLTLGGPALFFALFAAVTIGVHVLVAFTVSRLQDHSHAVSRLMTERQEREGEAAWAAQLQEALRLEALGRLSGGIAHDFNNLLTAILGFSEVARMSVQRNPHGAIAALSELESAADKAARLTAQLLDVASRRPAQPRLLDLNDAVSQSKVLIERLIQGGVKLEIEPCATGCFFKIDPSSFDRLLLNLAVNARDAMPQGGVLRLRVGREAWNGAEAVILEVKDTGTGIAFEDLPYIFEPFFSRKSRGKGTGLGLASVYGIVKQSAGDIQVESAPGQGTCFKVRWPAAQEPVQASSVPPLVSNQEREVILLVDDMDVVREVVEAHLRAAGFEVRCANDGEQALAILAEHHGSIHLLLTDVSMPGMSGIQLAQTARERAPDLPIVLMSGYAHDALQERGKLLSQLPLISKPFSAADLAAKVRAALDARRLG